MAVSKTTVLANIFKEFYDLVNAISGFSNTVYPTFSYNVKDASADYPQVVINSPEIAWDTWTFGKNMLTGTIDIEIYTTEAKDTDANADKVNDKIELSKTTLASAGLQKVHLESTTSEMVSHGRIKVHIKALTFAYTFTSAKTGAF